MHGKVPDFSRKITHGMILPFLVEFFFLLESSLPCWDKIYQNVGKPFPHKDGGKVCFPWEWKVNKFFRLKYPQLFSKITFPC